MPLSFPGDGFASIAVYNDSNEMIRTLAYAKPVVAGTETFTWDGTTDLGLPAAPGNYHVHGVFFTQPPKLHYLMKVGLSGDPPYLTPDKLGGWGGNEGRPMAICTNGKNLLAIFERVESWDETGVQLMDLKGKIIRRYGTFFPWDVRRACVMDDTKIYLAVVNQASNNHRLVIGKYDISDPKGKILCDIPVSENGKEPSDWNKGDWTADVLGLALNEGRLYVPVFYDDKLYVVDTVSGKILNTVSVPSPRGVASFNGKIFLLSGEKLVPIDADGNPGPPIISSGLDDPAGLAVDTQGNFYISDGGASQQVKVFTPDGKPLREIGIKGGRPRSGIYDPKGMIDPRGLCVTPDGRVWVMSANWDFQETSVWDTSGNRVQSFFNMSLGSGRGVLTPDFSEMLYSGMTDISAFKVDLANGTWSPSWYFKVTRDLATQADVFEPGWGYTVKEFDGLKNVFGFHNNTQELRADNGKTYLLGGAADDSVALWLFDPVTKTPRRAALVYGRHVVRQPNGYYQGQWNGPPNWVTWSDLNGDGKMSADEITYVEKPKLMALTTSMVSPVVQPDLSVWFLAPVSFKGNPYVADEWWIYRLPAHNVLPSGVPVYDWNDVQRVVKLNVPDLNGGDRDPSRAVAVTNLGFLRLENGAAYARVEPGPKVRQHLTGIDGDGWWASRNWRLETDKFDLKTGNPAWLKMGRRTPVRAKPGEMYYPGWGLAGSSHGVDFYADTMSQVWAWTDDGLFLGNLYNDNSGLRDPVYDANSIYIELTGSHVYDVGDKTYILTGDHGVSVHQIEFPTLTPLDGGAVKLTAEQSAHAKPWDPDGPPPGRKPVYFAKTIYNYDQKVQQNTRTITVDGRLDPAEWNGVPKMDLNLEGRKVGTVQVTFDKTNLYLAYDIADANGLKNNGQELPDAPFVTGSYVDFDLGRDWSMPNRPHPLDGDVRVILARITGESPTDYQMGFWPVRQDEAPFNPKPKQLNPQDIVSPAVKRHFDDISPVPGLTFAYQVTNRGYTLEVSVPFTSVGINPARQPLIGFDASVGLSDAGGNVRTEATHWAGDTETTVVDRPGSAELKPQTWGTLQFDRTPLPPVVTTTTNSPATP